MNFRVALVAAFVVNCIIDLFSTNSNLIECVRFLKENTRPKSRCQRNLKSTNSETNANSFYPKCIALSHPYCLDIRLPYNATYLPDYLPDLNLKSFEDVNNYLLSWQEVRKLPRCWPILQVALCSILMPQCEEDPLTGQAARIYRSNVDICNDLVNKEECRFIERKFNWPAMFNCNDTNTFFKNCTNELRDLKFGNTRTKLTCQYPLMATHEEASWFKDVGGCALHCKFPVSNQQDQMTMALFIRSLTLIGLCCTIAAIVLFRANQATSRTSKMSKVIKHCNMCQLLFYIGWSLQTFYNDQIACNSNGSALHGQPLVASPCVLSFVLTYLPSLSSLFWCAYLGRLCYDILDSDRRKLPKDTNLDSTLSFVNYGTPITLFVCVAFLGHIDGNGLYGICTVGSRSTIVKIVFVFVPSVVATVYGDYYFIRTIIRLTFATTTMKPDLRRNLMRILAFALLTVMQAVLTIVIHYYELGNQTEWENSIDNYLACNLNLQYEHSIESNLDMLKQSECRIDTTPIVSIYYLHLISTLGPGIVIASWSFHQSNFRGLRRKMVEFLEDEKDRERRAKNCLQAGGANNAGITQALLANGTGAMTFKETYHDLIDMTWPTSQDQQADVSDNRVQGAQDLTERPDTATKGLSLECTQLSMLQGRMSHDTSLSRRSSLRSTFIDFTNVTNASNQNINTGHVVPRNNQPAGRPSQNLNKYQGARARDIINQMRYEHQHEVAPQEVSQPNINDLKLITNEVLISCNFILSQLVIRAHAAQTSRTPRFLHALCRSDDY